VADRIAIVDDDLSVRRALGRLLRLEEFEVESFDSGEALLESGPVDRFACLVLDVHLGGISGLDLLGALRESGFTHGVVVITAHDDEATREKAAQAHASAYLRKPMDAQLLLAEVRNAVRCPTAA
jgi:FixJ family two-component response regulator